MATSSDGVFQLPCTALIKISFATTLYFELVMIFGTVVCRGEQKVEFFQISLLIHVDCCHLRRSLFHSAGSMLCMFFGCAALCFCLFLNLNSRSLIVRRILRGSSNAGGFFRSRSGRLMVLALRGMFTFMSCLSGKAMYQKSYRPGCSGLFRLMLLALFVSSATPLLTPPWLKDGVRFGDRDGFSILSTSCWIPEGDVHRDGFLPGFSSVDCCLDAPSRSSDVVRASSLWLVLRIQTTFLELTETTMLHVLKLDGVSALRGMFERDVMVSLVYLYFYWLVWEPLVALVLERFLHGTQDPELCAS